MPRFHETLAAALLSLLAAGFAWAGETIKLSSGLDVVAEALRTRNAGSPVPLVIDRPTLSPTETLRLLDLIEGASRRGAIVVAVCPKLPRPAGGGCAAVALSCNALVFVGGSTLSGAEAGWCLQPRTISQISTKCEKMAGLDRLLAERLCQADKALHWSSESGYSTTPAKVLLAGAGSPIQIDAALLESLSIEAASFDMIEDAVAAVGDGTVRSRVTAAGGAGKPRTPQRPSNPAGAVPEDAEKRLQPKVAEYDRDLADLQDLQRRFQQYWIGSAGVWTSQHRSLRAIWRAGSDHTEDAETRTTCQRLQRDMAARVTTLRTTAADIGRIAKDPEHPAVRRVKSHEEALEKYRDAVQRNKADLYEKWAPIVGNLK